MSNLIITQQDQILIIAFNRIDKHNAFDDHLLNELHHILKDAEKNADIRIIILKGNGKNFSAGADLQWMQRMSHENAHNNLADAQNFASLMATLANLNKTTIAMVHGKAIGGGVGLIAACDIAIAADNALFSCPEVKIGLIPAVISPYVINAIGARAARWLFLSAEVISASRAQELQLIHYCVPETDLADFTLKKAHNMLQHAPQAMYDTKALIKQVLDTTDSAQLQQITATLIAQRRQSTEAKYGINNLLSKKC